MYMPLLQEKNYTLFVRKTLLNLFKLKLKNLSRSTFQNEITKDCLLMYKR